MHPRRSFAASTPLSLSAASKAPHQVLRGALQAAINTGRHHRPSLRPSQFRYQPVCQITENCTVLIRTQHPPEDHQMVGPPRPWGGNKPSVLMDQLNLLKSRGPTPPPVAAVAVLCPFAASDPPPASPATAVCPNPGPGPPGAETATAIESTTRASDPEPRSARPAAQCTYQENE
jgi:hypothetical protein